MSKLLFNKEDKIDDFTFIIERKDYSKLGVVIGSQVRFRSNFNGPDEVSFRVFKDEVAPDLWERINDYNVLFVPELGEDGYFEMETELSEEAEGTYKTVTGTSLAESELSHTMIYNYEVNTEAERLNDEEWNADYLTVFYRDLSDYETALDNADPSSDFYKQTLKDYKKMKHVSLLHRLLDKLPNYSIAHVDSTLVEPELKEWYQFSWNDQSVYDILTGDVAEQFHVYFKFNSAKRTISAYDLYSVCQNDNCSYRTNMRNNRNIITRYRGDFKNS